MWGCNCGKMEESQGLKILPERKPVSRSEVSGEERERLAKQELVLGQYQLEPKWPGKY